MTLSDRILIFYIINENLMAYISKGIFSQWEIVNFVDVYH